MCNPFRVDFVVADIPKVITLGYELVTPFGVSDMEAVDGIYAG